MPSRKPLIPSKGANTSNDERGVRELEQFTQASLNQWKAASLDIDELQDVLFFGVEPERRRLRPQLVEALQTVTPTSLKLERWVRVVTYQHSLNPLSCAGSLQAVGGRFNAGAELDSDTLKPWPALYLAENFETAFREKFQMASDVLTDGLTPQELALGQGVSHSSLFVKGQLSQVFDITSEKSLDSVAKVLKRIKLPAKATQLRTKLRMSASSVFMAQTSKQIHHAVLAANWRVLPIQFGLPSPSQLLTELIRTAGYEAILYASTKGPGKCLAVFPDLLVDHSFVELIHPPPTAVKHKRLDAESAAELEGWESVAKQLRNR